MPDAALANPLFETTARLIAALQAQATDERRLALAKRVVRKLGDDAYPVFLKMLVIVAESDDDAAKQLIADLLAVAAQRIDLPSGALGAWGSSGTAGGSRGRLLGPIEYLTTWYGQTTPRTTLEEPLYADALGKLVTLFNRSPRLRALYVARLEADVNNELEGTYSRNTRAILGRIARRWQQSEAKPDDVVRAAIGGEAQTADIPRGWIIRRL